MYPLEGRRSTIRLMLGDCIERMKEIDDGSVDLTVTSPPYDNLRTYNGNNALWGEHVWKAAIKDLYRVTKDGGVVVWVVADATIKGSETGTSFRQALWAIECGFRLHDTMIWRKTATGGARGSLTAYNHEHEFMFVLCKGRPASVSIIKDKPNKNAGRRVRYSTGGKNGGRASRFGLCAEFGRRGNVWEMAPASKHCRRHPAPFPEALARDHIISWSNPGDTVLDPFMGSGTTGVACVKTKRDFIGIELDEGYFKIAEQRIMETEPPIF